MATTTKARKKATFENLKKKPAPTQKVVVPIVEDAAQRLSDAEVKVNRLDVVVKNQRRRPPKDDAPQADKDRWSSRLIELEEEQREAEAELAEAREYYEANSVEMVFKSIGRKAYEELVLLHPPSEADTKEAQKQLKDPEAQAQFNSDTFPIALVAVSCVEPEMTEEQVKELFEEWNPSEVMTLFAAAQSVNTVRQVGEMGKERG